jgi:hypothetical protein
MSADKTDIMKTEADTKIIEANTKTETKVQ